MDAFLSTFFDFEPINHWAIYEAVVPSDLRDLWTEILEFQNFFSKVGTSRKLWIL